MGGLESVNVGITEYKLVCLKEVEIRPVLPGDANSIGQLPALFLFHVFSRLRMIPDILSNALPKFR